MRIAMVGPFGFEPHRTTMSSRALKLAIPLVRRGHEVAIFMPPWRMAAEAGKVWEEEGVTLVYTPVSGGHWGITRKLIRAVRRWKPDVVHSFKPKAYSGLTAWWLWKMYRGRLKLVTDTDDWEGWGGWNDQAPYTPRQKQFFAWQEQWGMRHNHLLTVASRALETIALSMGIPREQILYLPNGPGIHPHATPLPRETKRSPTLLLYSRLFEFDTARLVRILRAVVTAVPAARIRFVGSGLVAEDTTTFRRQLDEADLSDAVEDLGYIAREHLPAVLSAGDAGIYLMDDTLLNRTKCPVKLADMAAMGIPVVAEAVGQVADYLAHGRTGYLHPPGAAAEIAADLIRLLQDENESLRLGAAARLHIRKQFNWDRLAERLESAYLGQMP